MLERCGGFCANLTFSYAKTVFKAYNGRVKTWSVFVGSLRRNELNYFRYTFNEPRVYCGQVASYPFSEDSVYQSPSLKAYDWE